MRKTYVAKRLLEHGPLSFREFCEITGWPRSTCAVALRGLVETGLAIWREPQGSRERVYELA